MTDFQNCWQCDETYPSSDLRGASQDVEAFYGRICIKCRIKEYLRKEIRQAQSTLKLTLAVTESLEGWSSFESWANSQAYLLHGDLSESLSDIRIYTRSQSRRYALIWIYLDTWYGGIVSVSSDKKTLVPIEGKWRLGGYASPVSAAVHALYILGGAR